MTNLGLTLLRIFAGIALMTHGIGKLPPSEQFISGVANMGFPSIFAWASGMAEFGGGILLLLGLLTRFASLFIVFNMATALIGIHWNEPFAKQELAFLFFFIALAFLFMGANSWSVDGILRRGR